MILSKYLIRISCGFLCVFTSYYLNSNNNNNNDCVSTNLKSTIYYYIYTCVNVLSFYTNKKELLNKNKRKKKKNKDTLGYFD